MTDAHLLLVISLSSSPQPLSAEYNRNKYADNWMKGVGLPCIIQSTTTQGSKPDS